MIKEYTLALLAWCQNKVILWGKPPVILFKEAELWWCSIGLNVGTEIFGKGKNFMRPVIVFKKFDAYSFLGIPLTTQKKQGIWYIPFTHSNKERMALLNQIRTLDSSRLTGRIGTMSDASFSRIRKSFSALYLS